MRIFADMVATEIVSISRIKANPSNPRVLRDEKFAKLKQSIQDFPDMLNYRAIVAVTDTDGKYMVLGGNMRLRALQDLGIKEAPVMLADHWTEEQRREFTIKDNVGFGEWDWDELANEWDAGELDAWGLDVPADFGAETNEGLTDPDEVPEPPKVPVTQPGDVWVMGKHRIVCGDSLAAPLPVAAIRVIDPPYDMPPARWSAMITDPSIVMCLGRHLRFIPEDLYRFERILVKSYRHRTATTQVDQRHAIVVQVGSDKVLPRDRAVTIASVVEHDGGIANDEHHHRKPVSILVEHLTHFSPHGSVLDPFCGSGTTIIAGEMTERSVHAIELSPEYVDVAVKRWQDFTGQKATHEATGKTFDELAEATAETVAEQS